MAQRHQVHTNGWISLPIDEVYIEKAKGLRQQRDQRYRNIYEERDTDERWVGELGEYVFRGFLKFLNFGKSDYEWIREDAAGKPDFVLYNSLTVDVKTVKRKVPPKADYTAQITAKHAAEDVDFFFFMTFEIKVRTMWLLGGIDKSTFLENATYYSEGEWVHKNYQVREAHGIYNAPISCLIPPREWAKKIQKHKSLTTSDL